MNSFMFAKNEFLIFYGHKLATFIIRELVSIIQIFLGLEQTMINLSATVTQTRLIYVHRVPMVLEN